MLKPVIKTKVWPGAARQKVKQVSELRKSLAELVAMFAAEGPYSELRSAGLFLVSAILYQMPMAPRGASNE